MHKKYFWNVPDGERNYALEREFVKVDRTTETFDLWTTEAFLNLISSNDDLYHND